MKQIVVHSILLATAMGCGVVGGPTMQLMPSVPDSSIYPSSPITIEHAAAFEAEDLAGTVTDHADFPMPEVLVEALSDGKRIEAVLTDSQGRFILKRRAPGLYLLKASKPGFDSQLIKVKVSLETKGVLRVTLTVSN